MSKLTMLAAGAVGYVLGTRAGRERYEKIKAGAQRVARDPRVRAKAQEAADKAKENAPVVKEKVTEAAHAARDKVHDRSSGTEDTAPVTGASTNSAYPSSSTTT